MISGIPRKTGITRWMLIMIIASLPVSSMASDERQEKNNEENYNETDTIQMDAETGIEDPHRQPINDSSQQASLSIALNTGYLDDPMSGYLVRAEIHLDGQQLKIMNELDGRSYFCLDVSADTVDSDGFTRSSGNKHLKMPATDADVRGMRKNGINVFLYIPAERFGSYYVRASAKDLVSGAAGSVYQYVKIPNPAETGFSLSNLYLVDSKQNATWIQAGMKEDIRKSADASLIDPKKSRPLRVYRQGEFLEFMGIIYNAPVTEGVPPKLKTQCVFYKDGKQTVQTKITEISYGEISDSKRIPFYSRFRIGKLLDPGSYIMKVCIIHSPDKGKQIVITQNLNVKISQDLAEESSQEPPLPKTLSIAESAIVKNETILEMPNDALRRYYSDALSDVEFEPSREPLENYLKHAGERVVEFFRDFRNVSAKEYVHMQRYVQAMPSPSNGKQPGFKSTEAITANIIDAFNPTVSILPDLQMSVEHFENFYYIIVSGTGSLGSSLAEYRTDKWHKPVDNKAMPGFIMCNGHAGKYTYLHPDHQSSSRFRYLGREKKKPYAHVIAFSQRPDKGDYLMQYSDADLPAPIRILVQGIVWLDPVSYRIVRMRTSMLQPEKPIALSDTIADIRFKKFNFDHKKKELWLPDEINISWEFPLLKASLIYRNRHLYSKYRMFSVASDYKIAVPDKK